MSIPIPENILLTFNFKDHQNDLCRLLATSRNYYGRRMGKIGGRILEINRVINGKIEARVLPKDNDVLPVWEDLMTYKDY